MATKQLGYRIDESVKSRFDKVCAKQKASPNYEIEKLMRNWLLENDPLRKQIEELKEKYEQIMEQLNVEKANGDLSKLINLKQTFDTTFDKFYDRKELRIKHEGAWNTEDDEPDFEVGNCHLEELLDEKDLKDLKVFYENYISSLEDELAIYTQE